MIPLDFFQKTLYNNFAKSIQARVFYINPTSVSIHKLVFSTLHDGWKDKNCFVMYDQEPIDFSMFKMQYFRNIDAFYVCKNRFLFTSEFGGNQEALAKRLNSHHIHYFYHALLCYEWYRQYWFENVEVNYDFNRTYIIYNNLTLDKRLYRSNLVIDLHNKNLLDNGHVSYNNNDFGQIENSANSYLLLPEQHKSNILSNLDVLNCHRIIDVANPDGTLSATIDIRQMQQAFVNVVTETIFYENSVHLTEKSFKPIVAKMPFILMAGAGCLAYLKRYGFKTFDKYWDESYDTITNSSERYAAVLKIIENLCNLPHDQLVEMKRDMADILEFNYNHFYTNMKPIVVDEMISNMQSAFDLTDMQYDKGDLEKFKNLLLY